MPILELTLQRKMESGYPVVAALTRLGGFLPLRREGILTLDPASLAELQYDPLAYGTALGQALFVDEIRDTFVKALGDEPLRVLLSIEAPDLRALDWHRLAAPFDGRWRCLGSQQNTPFSLAVPSPASAHFPALGRRDLRALVLVAGPDSLSGDYKLAPFDVSATIASIQTALGEIPCDVLDNPSIDALCAALTATPYTILHLVCHGAVNQNGETILFFPKDSKGTLRQAQGNAPTSATDLLNRLSSLARLPHFAFIAACESALPQNGLGPLAGRLVRELGLPAVLAMTDRVSIATASAIAVPFYAHLYQHGQPDLALAQSLAGLQGVHDLTVPAIFSRLGDRPLFDDNSERALTDKELEFGLAKLAESLSERAPIMDSLRDSLTHRLRSTLGADVHSLSDSLRTERAETLSALNSLSLEALDLSFNALCLGQIPPAYDSRSPFRGLESFRVEDAPYFFGRETLTKKLIQKLNEHHILAVLGASGSGKSSLVMAGLIPALNVSYAVFRPGAEPLLELKKALQKKPQLLVIDQFEELFTLSTRERCLEFISRLLKGAGKIWVVITLRADFLGEVAPFKMLKDEVQNHQEIIPPMDETELHRAMEGQATYAGLRFESDLSQKMLDDVAGEPGAMPLLQHALWTLWTRRHGRWLRAEEYRAFGGVKQAIASTAEAVYARCSEFERERLRDIFLRLTRLDEGADGRDTRRRIQIHDLIPAGSEPDSTKLLIKQLADARLVVVTEDEAEVAHEELIRHWERLRAWLNSDRENLLLMTSITYDAHQWKKSSFDKGFLNHRGPRLEQALELRKDPFYRFTSIEISYLDACLETYERERRDNLLVAQSQILIELSNSITQVNLGEREILELVHEKVTSVIDTDNMYIALYDELSDIVRFGLAYIDGQKQDVEFDQAWQPRKAGKGKTEEIIRTRQPIFHVTRAEAENWYAQPGHEEYIGSVSLSWIGVPILAGDKVLGAFAAYHPTKENVYSIDNIDFLQSVANLTASALENSNLFYKTNQRLDAIRDFGVTITARISQSAPELLELIHENLSRIMTTDNMYIALYDELSDIVRFGLAYIDGQKQDVEFDQAWQPRKAGKGKTEEIIRTRQPIFHVTRAEAENWYAQPGHEEYIGSPIPSWLGVPILFGDAVLGIVAVYDFEEYTYTNDDLFILSMFAGQIASPLYNTKLFDKFGNFDNGMQAFISVGQDLVSAPHLSEKEILNTIYTNTSQYLNAKNIFVAFWNNNDNKHDISRNENYLDNKNKEIENGIIEETIHTKHPLLLSRKDAIERYFISPSNKNKEGDNEIWMSVPMIIKNKMIGVLGIVQMEKNKIDRNDLMFLEGISNLISIAFENAQLCNNARDV